MSHKALYLLAVIASALLCAPTAITQSQPKAAAQESSVGRYQMATTATKTLKLDTVTGQTWLLDADSVWKPLANADSPENKTRVIAELVAESLIATMRYNPNSHKVETVTEVEKKQMVDAAVKQAFDAYDHPKTAEQYLRKKGVAGGVTSSFAEWKASQQGKK
jgi:hypothetical protein